MVSQRLSSWPNRWHNRNGGCRSDHRGRVSPVTSIDGGGGDDVIFSDGASTFEDTGAGNFRFATALNIDQTTVCSTLEDSDVGATGGAPHTKVVASGIRGEVDFFSVTVGAGQAILADLDYGDGGLGGLSEDTASDHRYASSKAAVRNHTKSVALYCAEQGLNIRCNSIHPAAILTPMWEPMLGDGPDREARMAAFVADTPMRRFGTVEEVASIRLDDHRRDGLLPEAADSAGRSLKRGHLRLGHPQQPEEQKGRGHSA